MSHTNCLMSVLLLLLMGLISCDTRCIKFTGKTQRITRVVADFNTLSVDELSPVRVILYQDNTNLAYLTGGKNILSHVQTNVDNQRLSVGIDIPRCDHLTQREITLEVPYQTLNSITHQGYDDIIFRDTLHVPAFRANLNDQGDLWLLIRTQQLSVNLARTANAEVSGVTDHLEVRTSDDPFAPSTSFGAFRGKNLTAKTCNILLQGEGNCEVRVSDTLRVDLRGVGNVIYYGTPKVIERTITGAGKVIKGN